MADHDDHGPAAAWGANTEGIPPQVYDGDDQHLMDSLEHTIRPYRRGSLAGSETFGPARQHDDANAETNQSSDVDTCRICRGEGTAEEPLFYPCKCSGSIKYVHQNCLMEWLSHSQKKHCELCKTPFRFTKLYASNMPRALPFHIFLGHLSKYLFNNLLVWLRGLLVISVWLGWLPYLMRSVWAFLFWISDEGMGGNSISGHAAGSKGTSNDGMAELAELTTTWVCPASPLFISTTTPREVDRLMDMVSAMSKAQLAKTLVSLKTSNITSHYSTVLRLLFKKSLAVVTDGTNNSSSTLSGAAGSSLQGAHPSLLGQVAFLHHLTRSPTFNRIVIAILEGQMITVAVIVCFILIILVRDYVVQQQPEINMRAAFGGENEQAPAPQPPQRAQGHVDVDAAENRPEDNEAGGGSDEEVDLEQQPIEGQRAFDLPPRSVPIDEDSDDDDSAWGTTDEASSSRRTKPVPDTEIPANWDDELTNREDSPVASSSDRKGKGVARWVDGEVDSDDEPLLTGNPLRPRANTDGPKLNTTINPLANNSWSFANLPQGESPRQQSSEDDVPTEELLDSQYIEAESSPPTAESSSGTGQDATPSSSSEEHRSPRAGSGWLALPEMEPVDEPTLLAEARPLRPQPPPVGAGLVDRVANFMWRDVDAIDPAELPPIVLDEADEDPVPALVDQAVGGAGAGNGEAVLEFDVVQAGFDMDAVEDAEDLDGILELLGMRGDLAGLFQNGIFCAFVVSVAIFAGVFLPYNIGRITLWSLANPLRPVRMLLAFVKFLQDLVVICTGTVTGGLFYLFSGWWKLFRIGTLPPFMDKTINTSWNMTVLAAKRITKGMAAENPLRSIISASEMRNFSALSHGALLTVKSYISTSICTVAKIVAVVFDRTSEWKLTDVPTLMKDASVDALTTLKALPRLLSDPSSWVISLSLPDSAIVLDPPLAYWSYGDRAWAVLSGYLSFSVVAGLYLRRGVPFSTGQAGMEIEASLIDILRQASGVVKVILIIGIEMLVFPFYCGLLLDVALLPLFEDATLKSRLLFTLNNPYTSCFVHWFVGTGYMFHFALFVSMCRKIMRKGVLYFIRDPDDPEFHPVRDVLERNVTTQLRKILFSAFVYGALVVVCLGGVVWGLAYSIPGVLPIHYSSNEPVLEFPIDLLFYNFLMPLAVKFFKPSDALHALYTWWFRKCARALRITWFLFGERKIDEEGTLALAEDSPHKRLPWWRRSLLEVAKVEDGPDGPRHAVVPKTWKDTFEGGTAIPSPVTYLADMMKVLAVKRELITTKQLHPDGRFVRVPASDQIKIPKDKSVFLEVSERNMRLDGKPDLPETDLYSTEQYQIVYVPPWFRVRIFFFIASIWIFAAVTGVGITIVPLVFGRHMFKLLIPAHIRTNDIYAFSIGIYILGSLTYTIFHAGSMLLKARTWFTTTAHTLINRQAIRRTSNAVLKIAKLIYAYFFLLAAFPFMVVSLLELYLLIPLHTYMYGAVFSSHPVSTLSVTPSTGSTTGTVLTTATADINPKHTIRVIQAWTIGLLYLKLASRVVTHYYPHTRLSSAIRAVLRRGWTDPDVAILTRAFIIPGTALWASLVFIPLLVGRVLIAYGVAEQVILAMVELFGSSSPTQPSPPTTDFIFTTTPIDIILPDDLDKQLSDAVTVLIYRMSYPLTQMAIFALAFGWHLVIVFKGWKVRIRDEAYLIGERLHNFGGGMGGGVHARVVRT